MEDIKTIFEFCTQIMRIKIDLFGYSVTLFSVIVFVFVGGIIITFLRRFS